MEAIRKFNFKPKRGIKELIEKGFIKSSSPQHIAEFILANTNSLDKRTVGEYLGEGDAENIATMHAFVDAMDFSRMRFVFHERLDQLPFISGPYPNILACRIQRVRA